MEWVVNLVLSIVKDLKHFHAVPGIKIVACSTPTNAKGLMKAAIRDDNPVLFFEHVLLYNLSEELPEGDYTCALDQADVCLLYTSPSPRD